MIDEEVKMKEKRQGRRQEEHGKEKSCLELNGDCSVFRPSILSMKDLVVPNAVKRSRHMAPQRKSPVPQGKITTPMTHATPLANYRNSLSSALQPIFVTTSGILSLNVFGRVGSVDYIS